MNGSTQQVCRPCTEPLAPVSAVTVAVVVVLAVIAIYYLTRWLDRRHKDGFVSQQAQEIYNSSRDLFGRTQGNATYSEFKTSASGVDPVMYTDIRSAWKAGELTPERVQGMM
jgi:type II secretory pathway pseudopilin PulG